jgi:enterochelin esterase-like enzyme
MRLPFLLAAALVASAALSQEARPPMPRNGAGPIVSPDLRPDRSVTFRLRAPNAKAVSVVGAWPQGGSVGMSNDGQGVWSASVGPLAPEIYEYGFVVDGLRIVDPGNPNIKPQRSPNTSLLEVPGTPPLLHEFQDVAHGTVRSHTYRSAALGRLRRLHVYTPPDYDRDRARFPVLYLFHGAGDNDATWTAGGRAHWILDNLIAQGKAKPMLVVMTDGHAASFQLGGPGGLAGLNPNVVAFEKDLLQDVMPFVERTYRVREGAANRAIVGLSMGGGQSLTIGMNHADRFAWVGGFSSAVGNAPTTLAPALSDVDATNKRLKLLWIACGQDDFLIGNNRQFAEFLKGKGVRHQFLETEGNHSWPVWRKYLAQFVPLLFGGTK